MISPDGRRVTFAANVDGKRGLWLRDLDALSARLLPGTDGATYPFWSPDSRWVAFFAGGKLKKMDVTGGPALTLCDVAAGREGAWNKDDVIVYGVNRRRLVPRPRGGRYSDALKRARCRRVRNQPSRPVVLARWPPFPLHGTQR